MGDQVNVGDQRWLAQVIERRRGDKCLANEIAGDVWLFELNLGHLPVIFRTVPTQEFELRFIAWTEPPARRLLLRRKYCRIKIELEPGFNFTKSPGLKALIQPVGKLRYCWRLIVEQRRNTIQLCRGNKHQRCLTMVEQEYFVAIVRTGLQLDTRFDKSLIVTLEVVRPVAINLLLSWAPHLGLLQLTCNRQI